MSWLLKVKTIAEIADLGSKAYGVLVDKSRARRDKDQRIRDLEKQVAELKAKAGVP